MNTELFEYLKELSKKEFFALNGINTVLSVAIILIAIVSLFSGRTSLSYSAMFSCAAVLLATNSYKCFKRESKNGGVLAFFSLAFLINAIVCIYYTVTGM